MNTYRNLLLCLCLVFCIPLHAQNFKAHFKKAQQYYKSAQYDRAISQYKRALKFKKGNLDATYGLGLSYLFSAQKEKALPYLKNVRQLDPKIDREIDYHLGLAYQYNYDFYQAKKSYIRYKERNKKRTYQANLRIAQCDMGDSLYLNPRKARIVNLGEKINSRWHDYTPLITTDGKTLFFTSNRSSSTGGKKLPDGSYYEDIYYCYWQDGEWSEPKNVSTNINTRYHDAAASISPDGKTLFTYSEKGSGDIYESKKSNGEWSVPTPLSDQINSVFWETSVSITADGKTIYFTSDRPGGFGGLDIYKCDRKEDGTWGMPRNLGPTINTAEEEDSPVIHPDGQTLYFSSAGHTGMGGFDIFFSKMKDGRFQLPVNLGYPINTVFDDNYFVISADRKKAYYASQRVGGVGGADLYLIEMTFDEEIEFVPEVIPLKTEPIIAPKVIASNNEPEIQPVPETEDPPVEEVITEQVEASVKQETIESEDTENTKATSNPPIKETQDRYFDENILALKEKRQVVTVIKGKVLDASNVDPLTAQIRLINNENNTLAAEVYSDAETGEFELVIPHGGNYGVSTSSTGYLFNSINFSVPAFSEYQEIDISILLDKARVGSKMVLKNIFFDTGSSGLRTESLGELEVIKNQLEDAPNLKVQINGHTDNVGNAVYNKVLSKKRAQAVIDYLISHGIEASRLQAKGYGEERPLVSNDDEMDGREINRRTEFEIIDIGQGSGS